MKLKTVTLISLTFLAIIMFLSVSSGEAADNPFVMKKLPFKTAEIHYKLEGTESGTATEYWERKRNARHADTKTGFMGIGARNRTITITTPKRVIQVDLVDRKATATGNWMTYMAEEYEKLSASEKKRVKKNAGSFGNSFFQGAPGGKPEISEGTFMGKKVQITKMMGFTSYTWKGTPILLKHEGTIMGMKTSTLATSVKTGVSIKSSVFEVPAGIEVVFDQQADQQMRLMAKRWLDWLKDPDFDKKMAEGKGPGLVRPGDLEGGSSPQKRDAPASDSDASAEQATPQEEESMMEQGKKKLKELFKW